MRGSYPIEYRLYGSPRPCSTQVGSDARGRAREVGTLPSPELKDDTVGERPYQLKISESFKER